jgi:hypothetical protein
MNRIVLLAGLAVLLGGVLAAELLPDAPPTDAPLVPEAGLAVPAPPAPASAVPDPARWVDVLLARPLFSPGRRPAAEAASAGAELPRLAGIIITPAGRRAIFAAAGAGRPSVLAEGERIGGYVVRSIAPAQVVVSGPEGDRVIHPSLAKSPEAGQQAASAGVAPP